MREGKIESIRARLLNLSRSRGESFDFVLARYGVERFLHRLAHSPEKERFVLKGATLFLAWNRVLHRPTRDLDLLGFGPDDPVAMRSTVTAILGVRCPEDGLVYDVPSLSIEPIRDAAGYGGLRVKLRALLGNVRVPVQVDVGFGDAVTPAPVLLDYPVMLPDMPGIRMRSYPVATVIAEKFEALVRLDEQNSRMKDFFDLDLLLGAMVPDRREMVMAVRATFARRGTALPDREPVGLSEEFVNHRRTMWDAFLRKNGLEPREFGDVVGRIRVGLKWAWEGS